MAESKTLRLNKVLRELNISLDRAVEHLSAKGFEIEARPTTKISSEEYEVLLDGFQTDRSKRKEIKEVRTAQEKEKEDIRRVQEEAEQKRMLEKEKKEEVLKAKSETLSIKQVGKIEIEKPRATEKAKAAKAEEKPTKTDKSKPKQTKESEETEVPDEKVETQYKKLDGPKLTGDVIDLKQFDKPKKKPSVSASKRKRRRIVKPVTSSDTAVATTAGKRKKDKRGGRSSIQKEEPTDAEIQKQIRETLEKLQKKSSKGSAAKYRREKRDLHRLQTEEDLKLAEEESNIIKVTEFVTVSELATMMDVPVTNIISACMTLGMMVTLNQRLDAETMSIVAEEFDYKVEFVTAELEEAIEEEDDDPADMVPRSPIITVMGHVDHGKTSLLDYIRKTNVIAGESGGITQHIGAYSVQLENDQKITFLDTPGHEAFTAMRARGAQVTDLAVIVIAADDAIMPQTEEAISHAQAAGVPIVFAINKIDKEGANPEKVKEQLAAKNLLVEDWGGKIQSHDISAKVGTDVNELLEKVLLEAELLELKANPNKRAVGTVVEALLDKGRGYVSTILVQGGTLKKGDYLLAGTHSGKIKAMFDERGNNMEEAGPSTPVSILGLDGAPQAGDKFYVFEDEREAKQIATKRSQPAILPTFDILYTSRISTFPVTSSFISGDNMPSMASFNSLMAL